MYKLEDVEPMVVAAWRDWAKERGSYTGTDMLIFFGWLQQNKPGLLQFRGPGDKWQRVHGWLQRDEDMQSRLRA